MDGRTVGRTVTKTKSTLQSFNPVDKAFAQIFHILLFYIILCPHCDVTSQLICINQNLA